MKKIAFLVLCALFVSSLNAQKVNDKKDNRREYKRTPEQVAEDYSAKLVEITGISAEQKTKIYDLKLKEVTDIRAIVADNSLAKPDKQPKIKEIRKNFRAELKTILTPEQLEKLKAEAKNKKKDKKDKKGKKGKKADVEDTETAEPINDVE